MFNNSNLLKALMLLFVVATVATSCKKDDDDKKDTNTQGEALVSGTITGERKFSADTIYELSGYVVVESGATLTIDPGTILKFQDGQGAAASALIVARGGKIYANGTATDPIIMTSYLDDITFGETVGSLDETTSGLWGGFLVLGNAKISANDGDTEAQIEGLPANRDFGKFGGTADNDNSGSITYVSIRHNGIALEANQELQGLTLGGVGRGTTIHHIEVVASKDDGVEIFGGNVNLDDVVLTYMQDDGLDLDMNYNGSVDNLFVGIAGPALDNAGFEFDGPEGTTYTDGKFTVTNATVVKKGGASGPALLKSGAQGTISNSKFVGFTNGITVSGGSATANFVAGDLEVTGCELEAASFDLTVTGAASATDSTAILTTFGTDNSAVTSFTVGADLSAFRGWTWADATGKLD